MTINCAKCTLDLSIHTALPDGACPNCGELPMLAKRAAQTGDTDADPENPFQYNLRNTVKDLILNPAKFYSTKASELVSKNGLSQALAFALVIDWIGSFFNFIWRSLAGGFLERHAGNLMKITTDVLDDDQQMVMNMEAMRDRTTDFLFGAGSLVLAPFLTLIKLTVSAILIHMAVRFFIDEKKDRPHSYQATLKILAYASAPAILCVIPGIGLFASWILGFFAAVVGISEVYKTTKGRAVFAVIFPELLFMALFLAGILFIVFMGISIYQLLT